jgi:hypothetical protein
MSVVEEGRAPGYLSVSVMESSYAGGAHPIGGGTCYLVDTHTGADVNLVEVLGPGKEELLKQVGTQLRDFWKDNGMDPYTDVPTDLENGKLCYGGPDKLEVRFNPYEVAPYVYGPVTLDVDLEPLLAQVPKSAARTSLFSSSVTPDASAPACPSLEADAYPP